MQMPLRLLITSLIILAALVACAPTSTPKPVPLPPTTIPPTLTPVPPTPTPAPPVFNFPTGATWTYQGTVKWDEKGKAQQKTLTWKMQITDKIDRGDGIVAYVLKGHPIDLAWYSTGKQPGDYLYLARANQVYLITVRDAKLIGRMKDKNDALADLLTDANLAFDFPLTLNKSYGSLSVGTRQDAMYTWIVTAAKTTPLTGIQGVTPVNAIEYTLELRTNPDRQTVYYVPTIGITRYVYHHNGTLSDVDVKLIEYNPSGTASVAPSGTCELAVTKPLTAYTRPSTAAAVFGQITPSDTRPVGGMTADGWIGFEPGVAQAANVGPFRLRWVQKSDATKLAGACDAKHVPVVASLPPTACFEMFMDQTQVYATADKSSAVLVTAKPEDYAQVIAANDKWLELDLKVGTLSQNKTGWIDRAAANFNGPCDKLPIAK